MLQQQKIQETNKCLLIRDWLKKVGSSQVNNVFIQLLKNEVEFSAYADKAISPTQKEKSTKYCTLYILYNTLHLFKINACVLMIV